MAPNFKICTLSFLNDVDATLKLGCAWASPNKQEILAKQAIMNRFIEDKFKEIWAFLLFV